LSSDLFLQKEKIFMRESLESIICNTQPGQAGIED
jgi:hypothetical protein